MYILYTFICKKKKKNDNIDLYISTFSLYFSILSKKKKEKKRNVS